MTLRKDRDRYALWLAEHCEAGRAALSRVGQWGVFMVLLQAIPPRPNQRKRPQWARVEAVRNEIDDLFRIPAHVLAIDVANARTNFEVRFPDPREAQRKERGY